MASTAHAYGGAVVAALSGQLDYLGGTVKASIMTNAYTPDAINHRWWSQVSADEIADSGYAPLTLAGKAIAWVDAAGAMVLSCDDWTWAPFTMAAASRYMVVWVDTGTPTTSPLLCYLDWTGTFQAAGTSVVVTFVDYGLLDFMVP